MKKPGFPDPVTPVENLEEYGMGKAFPNENLSFEPFVAYLQGIEAEHNFLKRQYLNELISQFLELIQIFHTVPPSSNIAIRQLFELTDQTLTLKFDLPDASFDIYTMPACSELLYIREELTGLLTAAEERDRFTRELNAYLLNEEYLRSVLCYKAIWTRNTDSPCLLIPEIILPFKSSLTGQQNYYLLVPDFSFMLIESELTDEFIGNIIEEIDASEVSAKEVHERLKQKLPLFRFTFKGFGRIKVSDLTVPYITKLIASQVVAAGSYEQEVSYLKDIHQALKVIAGNSNLKFGLFPMFQLNGKFIFSEHFGIDKPAGDNNEASQKSLFNYLTNVYRLNPYRIYLKNIVGEMADRYEYLKNHCNNGVKSFALVPVFYHDQFVGVLEAYSTHEDDLSKTTLTRLETFFPVLSIVFKKCIDGLNQAIQEIIKTKFTSLQSSVQWRFNQAAWKYMENSAIQEGLTEIEDIEFDHVYPLYGAIDVKDSTVKRNRALREDTKCHLQLLIETLTKIKEHTSFGLLNEKISACKQWQEHVDDEVSVLQEAELIYFFENDIGCFLKDLAQGKSEIAIEVGKYINAIDEDSGIVTEKSRKLEKSMSMVINTINDLVDSIQQQAQIDFPCFFEKFRTDGVEYDIYIGQSITPEQPFKHVFIENLRLLQLDNMIEIAQCVSDIQSQIPVSVDITQLIFVNPNFIDIRFRRDERRFDVEGAYNIRYHIVKKRIDKVLIKNTTERLTAPGKIAIVYFNQRDADEYLIHIRYLQRRQLLTDEIEFLELEQLQGVAGLKALRVAIQYNNGKLKAS